MTQSETDFTIGEDLYGISVDELSQRITVLKSEISRIEGELAKKRAERDAAESVFGGSKDNR